MEQSGSPARESPNRWDAALAQIREAASRSPSRETLFGSVVRALVEHGTCSMAFLAWHNPATAELSPVARWGDEKGYIARIRIFADEKPEGQGPTGTAFRTGTTYVCNDFLNDPKTCLWRKAARHSGWRASVAVPVVIEAHPRGVLSAYAVETGYFTPPRVALLEQAAKETARGVQRLEAEQQQTQPAAAASASERRLKFALEAAGIGTFDWDLATEKIVWDKNHERLFGMAPEEFDGTYASFERRIHPEDLAALKHQTQIACDTRTPYAHEFRVVWPDGSVHWVNGLGEFFYSESGQPVSMYGAVLDITERRRAEAALRESEERLRQATRVADIGIFDHDQMAGTIYCSPELRRISGCDREIPVTLDYYLTLIHPGDRDRLEKEIQRAHDPNSDGRFEAEHRFLLSCGAVRWVRVRSQTFFEGDGNARHPVRTIGAVNDITEHKLASDEQNKLATLVAMNRDFVGIATLDGQVVYLNQAAMTLAGVESAEELRGKTIFDFFPDNQLEKAKESMNTALRSRGHWSGESRLRHFRTGEALDVEITAFTIVDDAGAPRHLACVIRDLRERKKAEADRAKLETQLFQAQKMESIGRLAGGVAHDFNNMLTVILGFTALTKSTFAPGDERLASLEEIERAANRSRDLTKQLLGFSRRQIIAPEPSNLNDLLAEMKSPLARLIGEDVELLFRPDPALWMILVDPSQIHQVVLNLAVNARDAMPYGGKLTLETANVRLSEDYSHTQIESSPGPYAVLAVSDNGTGMSKETLSHVFEPFFTTKERGKGTGLGLATVYGIARQNGGFVNVYSEPERGTTFKVYFPAMAAAQAVPARSAPGVQASGWGTVLVVEDDELVRKIAAAALERLGYTVLVAAGPHEALAVCGRLDVNLRLMVSDVVMPGMNGAELAERVRSLRPGLRVLFMSGYTSNVIVDHGVLKEGVHFIQKPFSMPELARKVSEALSGD